MTGLDPATSLAMTYLRAYVDEHRTRRGMRRATRKAEHQLRMHWSVVATDAAREPQDGRRATKTRSEGEDTREGICDPQIAHVRIPSQGGLMDRITWTGGL